MVDTSEDQMWWNGYIADMGLEKKGYLWIPLSHEVYFELFTTFYSNIFQKYCKNKMEAKLFTIYM